MATKNPWIGFEGDGYRIKNLGRPATFLIPTHKLRQKFNGVQVVTNLEAFLLKEFGAFTASSVPSFGLWLDDAHEVSTDECRQYEVAFVGVEGIRKLIAKLAEIARAVHEECFYFKAGEDACLIYPTENV